MIKQMVRFFGKASEKLASWIFFQKYLRRLPLQHRLRPNSIFCKSTFNRHKTPLDLIATFSGRNFGANGFMPLLQQRNNTRNSSQPHFIVTDKKGPGYSNLKFIGAGDRTCMNTSVIMKYIVISISPIK